MGLYDYIVYNEQVKNKISSNSDRYQTKIFFPGVFLNQEGYELLSEYNKKFFKVVGGGLIFKDKKPKVFSVDNHFKEQKYPTEKKIYEYNNSSHMSLEEFDSDIIDDINKAEGKKKQETMSAGSKKKKKFRSKRRKSLNKRKDRKSRISRISRRKRKLK